MTLPLVQPITEDLARPFISDYCERWEIPYDEDEGLEYGQCVLWVGAFYENALRAVVGVLQPEAMPNTLFVYGFYGDGSIHQLRPIRALIEFVDKLPYAEKSGFIICSNEKMLATAEKYGWTVTDYKHGETGKEAILVEKRM